MIPLIETLSALGGWLGDHLWRLSVELAVLAAVVWVALRLLRVRSPAVRHLFWCLVLAKPVATMLVASPVSLYWFLTPQKVQIVAPAAPERMGAYQPSLGARGTWSYGRYGRPAGEAELTAVAAPPLWRQLDRRGVLALAWLAVAVAFALRMVVGWAYVVFLRSTAVVQREGLLPAMVRQVASQMGVRRQADIAISEVRHGPVLAGILAAGDPAARAAGQGPVADAAAVHRRA